MPRSRNVVIPLTFPIGGVVRRYAYQKQGFASTPDANNIWPTDGTTGRERGATRPGLTSATPSIGVPRNWCEIAYDSSGFHRGVAVACSNGAWTIESASSSAVELITDSASSDFCSVACYRNNLYFARGTEATLYRSLASGSGSGTALSNAGGGTAPTKCGLVEVHEDRLVLAGDTDHGNIIYFSATGDPTDWDYADTSPSAAVAITVPGIITAIKRHTEGCLIICCTDSTYVIRGNPRTGRLALLSPEVGALMQSALAHDSAGNLWMWTRDGLYMMPAGCGGAPQSVSAESLPLDLREIDPGTSSTYVSLAYDQRFRKLHLYYDKPSGTDQHWVYDLQAEGGGFWPMSFSTTLRLGVPLKSAATTTKSALLAITAAGAVSQFDTASSETISSYYLVGPVALGGGDRMGKMLDLVVTLGESSGAVTPKVFVGDSPTQAYAAYVADTPAWTGGSMAVTGLNYRQHPQIAGSAAYVYLAGTNNAKFQVEEVYTTLWQGAGPRRVSA